MKSAAFPESAGQQLAEAVIAAALALPLVLGVGGLRNSRLSRAAAALQKIDWSSPANTSRQPVQTLDPRVAAFGPSQAPESMGESRSSEARRPIQKNRHSAQVAGPESSTGDGAQTPAPATGVSFPAAFAKTEDVVIYFQQPDANLVKVHGESSLVPSQASRPEGGNAFAQVIEGHDVRVPIDDNEQQ